MTRWRMRRVNRKYHKSFSLITNIYDETGRSVQPDDFRCVMYPVMRSWCISGFLFVYFAKIPKLCIDYVKIIKTQMHSGNGFCFSPWSEISRSPAPMFHVMARISTTATGVGKYITFSYYSNSPKDQYILHGSVMKNA